MVLERFACVTECESVLSIVLQAIECICLCDFSMGLRFLHVIGRSEIF